MEHRRTATAIARHFPTVEQLGLASLGGVLAKDGLFQHPQQMRRLVGEVPWPASYVLNKT